MAFDPTPYLKNLAKPGKAPRWYLQTMHRILWFRTDHPDGQISTEIVQVSPFPIFRAAVTTGDGKTLATGYGSAQAEAGKVYSGREVEKAETAAIGRALGNAGYGTQFTEDTDESDHLADSPTTVLSNPNPFGNEAAQAAIVAALGNHGMNTPEGRSFVYDNINLDRAYNKFAQMHADGITPDDVLTRLPALAAKFHLTTALQQGQPDGESGDSTPEEQPDETVGDDAPDLEAMGLAHTPDAKTRMAWEKLGRTPPGLNEWVAITTVRYAARHDADRWECWGEYDGQAVMVGAFGEHKAFLHRAGYDVSTWPTRMKPAEIKIAPITVLIGWHKTLRLTIADVERKPAGISA